MTARTKSNQKLNEERPWGAHFSIVGGLSQAVSRAEAVAATAMQIFTRNQRQWRAPPLNPGQVAAFRAARQGSSIRFLCTHASYLCNPASADAELRTRTRDVLVDEIDRAEQIGACCVVLHPGAAGSSNRVDALARVTGTLDSVMAATAGFKAGIAIENTAGQGTGIGAAVEELAAIFEGLDFHPRLGLCLDSAHAFAAGIDLRQPMVVDSWLEQLANRNLLDRVWLLHLNDSLGKCGSGLDRHTHIGKGEIGDGGFVNIVRNPKLRKIPVVVETPKGGDFASARVWDRRNLTRLRKLAGSSGAGQTGGAGQDVRQRFGKSNH